MNVRRKDSLVAARMALETRRSLGIDRSVPVNVFDVAGAMNIALQFRRLPSLEGLYVKEPGPLVVVSSMRPPGRQAFNCAHEIGHHVFGHGTRVDEYISGPSGSRPSSPEEHAANTFAAHLLMPKRAVEDAFARRGWNARESTPSQVHVVAGQLGVGYSALVNHLCWSLRLVPRHRCDELLRDTPKKFRERILGDGSSSHLVVVDEHWWGRPIDLEVGHIMIVPQHVLIEGAQLVKVQSHVQGAILRATLPGIVRAHDPESDWASFVRISREGYDGLAEYRHLEDPDVD